MLLRSVLRPVVVINEALINMTNQCSDNSLRKMPNKTIRHAHVTECIRFPKCRSFKIQELLFLLNLFEDFPVEPTLNGALRSCFIQATHTGTYPSRFPNTCSLPYFLQNLECVVG